MLALTCKPAETDLFFRGLSAYGTNFDGISKLFDNRDQRQIKVGAVVSLAFLSILTSAGQNKFLKEDKLNRDKVTQALRQRYIRACVCWPASLCSIIAWQAYHRPQLAQEAIGHVWCWSYCAVFVVCFFLVCFRQHRYYHNPHSLACALFMFAQRHACVRPQVPPAAPIVPFESRHGFLHVIEQCM